MAMVKGSGRKVKEVYEALPEGQQSKKLLSKFLDAATDAHQPQTQCINDRPPTSPAAAPFREADEIEYLSQATTEHSARRRDQRYEVLSQ